MRDAAREPSPFRDVRRPYFATRFSVPSPTSLSESMVTSVALPSGRMVKRTADDMSGVSGLG